MNEGQEANALAANKADTRRKAKREGDETKRKESDEEATEREEEEDPKHRPCDLVCCTRPEERTGRKERQLEKEEESWTKRRERRSY